MTGRNNAAPSVGASVDLRITGVRKSFPNGQQRLEVLHDVSLETPAGTQIAVTGESGSGKSTLLSLIAGLDTPDSGQILVGGQRVDLLEEAELTQYRSATVGLVFQFHYLLRDFTTLENVMMPALLAGGTGGGHRREAEERAAELLGRVGLGERLTHLPAQLSGGERQRVALARALVNEPPLVLADEPTGNLDDRNSRLVEDTLFELVAGGGRTLVLVTHNRGLASRTGRVLELEMGCLAPR
jgi:lipoprotein-releasing system ATP-binding protein